MEWFDYVVLGSGAGGATAFVESAAKYKTLLVEEGEFTADEIKNSTVKKVFRSLYRDGGIRPAIGLPSIAIGEGKCIGGSTEINGGLFWRTPKNIVEEWRTIGHDFAASETFEQIFGELENELSVCEDELLDSYDEDSALLLKACKEKGWLIVPAKRMMKKCVKSNLCASGCPSGAKQTMSRTFIKTGLINGGTLISGWRAESISIVEDVIQIKLVDQSGLTKTIFTKYLTISCGAIETRRLLIRSGLMKETFGKISFHANAKLIAKFKGKLNAHLGTIFTHQLQEFLADGFLFMPTNFNRAYLAMASSTINSSVYRQLVEESDYVGMFTAQFRTNGKLIDVRITKNRFLLLSYLTRSDLKKIKHYLNISCDLLFSAGAEYIQLPIPGTSPIHSMQEAKVVINRVNRGRLSLSTVHLMSSLPIPVFGSKTVSTLDHKGRLNRYPRINVMDASILPTSIGESPQATIMAMVRMFCKDIFKVKT